jgi:hypothetical protein
MHYESLFKFFKGNLIALLYLTFFAWIIPLFFFLIGNIVVNLR